MKIIRFASFCLAGLGSLTGAALRAQNVTQAEIVAGNQNMTLTINHQPPVDSGNTLDSDKNGLPDAWEQRHFGHLGVDLSADPDGDGLVNILEYQYGKNPNVADNEVPPVNPDAGPVEYQTGTASYLVIDLGQNFRVDRLANNNWVAGYGPSGFVLWHLGSTLSLPMGTYWLTDVNEDGKALIYRDGVENAQIWDARSDTIATLKGGSSSFTGAGELLSRNYIAGVTTWRAEEYFYSYEYDLWASDEDGARWRIDGMSPKKLGGAFIDHIYSDFFQAIIPINAGNRFDVWLLNDNGDFAGAFRGADTASLNGMGKLPFWPVGLNNNKILIGQETDDWTKAGWWQAGTWHVLSASPTIATSLNNRNDVLAFEVDGVFGVPLGLDLYLRTGPRPEDYRKISIDQSLPPHWQVDYLASYSYGVSNAAKLTDSGTVALYALHQPVDAQGQPSGPVEHRAVLLVPAQLAVDANHDGAIKLASEDASDATSADKPFRFWINDDDDGNALNDEQEVVGGTAKDYESRGDFGIASKRDLEDFARLWFSVKDITAVLKSGDLQLGFKWADGYTGTPKINLYLHYEADGGTKYLTDTPTAAGQTSNPWSATLVSTTNKDVVAPGDVFILKKDVFARLTEELPTTHFLFEGAGEGKGQLQMVILDKNGVPISEGPGVWLDLKNIKTMYERATVSPDTTYYPYLFGDQPGSDSYLSFTTDTTYAFVKPPDEEAKALVFVHGWNMTYDEYLSFSETMFKRLWWQGYKGRFCSFRWGTLTLTDLDSYNTSEFWAWRYGDALRDYIENPSSEATPGLKVRLPGYAVNIAAHSMGNIVSGSALRRGATVRRYFLMEAAIPSGCYNESVNNYQRFLDAEVTHPTPDVSADLGYRLYLQSVSGNADKVVNFYSEIDFALATGSVFPIGQTNWEKQQESNKPDDPAGSGQYHYDQSQPIGQRSNLTYVTGSRPVLDMFECLSYVARPRSKALGAEPNSPSVIPASIDLQSFDFGRGRGDHSGQFTRRIQQLEGFYKKINDELK